MRDGLLQIRDVLMQRVETLDRDRPLADRSKIFRAVAFRDQFVPESGNIVEVLRGRARDVAREKTGEAVADVGRVADLAHLAVAYDVDAGIDLTRHCGGDGMVHGFVVLRPVVRFAAVFSEE